MTWLQGCLRIGLIAASGALLGACFGDNSDNNPDGNPGSTTPSVTEIASPDGLDPGDTASVTVKVKGKPATQLSIVVDGVLGTFDPPSKLVITDDAGEATWVTQYTVGDTSGDETITANVSDLAGAARSATKSMTVYAVERLGNVAPVGPAEMQVAGVLLAYPMVLDRTRVVTKLGIVSPTQPAPVPTQVGLYATDTATSVSVIAKTTANIVGGVNQISIPKQELVAGTYWMVVAYDGTPQIYRSPNLVQLRYKTTHVFSGGLADTITGLTTSAPDLASPLLRYYARNFFLVVRQ
ncbi:MAG: hypothetical protein R3B48_14980 [Kofleriaceae bacterium]